MPNRTIYVAEADLPLLEKAQTLAGGNLSAAIVQALKHFVKLRDVQKENFEEITVVTGKITKVQKRFYGRLLVEGRFTTTDKTCSVLYKIYLTPKQNFAVYTQSAPYYPCHSDHLSSSQQPSDAMPHWSNLDQEGKLDVFASLEALAPQLPRELYEAVASLLHSTDNHIETLDI
ncbi:EXLDI family protein [Thermosporothrix hazakensis]|jgi:EXLDI family protein|uniref:EXLDI family protein n=1 Tax=Thermosporothrix hazakensis TaxID=644383 RepID=A0A326U1G4_THEHA|nr:EXLDI protein [Thermosporothrix hazakensis]PZW24728.1 EXLDI family protein [Thermosporothrix hazakensis]GCE48326.1 hypothetical protein KTH_31950 [Thermosporothrix hazakensis]